jgi:hypothetical protein
VLALQKKMAQSREVLDASSHLGAKMSDQNQAEATKKNFIMKNLESEKKGFVLAREEQSEHEEKKAQRRCWVKNSLLVLE